MKQLNIKRGVLIGLCAFAFTFTGCGSGNTTGNVADTTENVTDNGSAAQEDTIAPDVTESNDANELIDSSTMQGSVTDFSESGCTVSQITSEDGGQSAKIAAPGNENSDTTVTVKYAQNCVFQIAVINRTTEKATMNDASISDIKKQTSLTIYGEFEDTHNLNAEKVIITRYE